MGGGVSSSSRSTLGWYTRMMLLLVSLKASFTCLTVTSLLQCSLGELMEEEREGQQEGE